jgi:hypothetical protein
MMPAYGGVAYGGMVGPQFGGYGGMVPMFGGFRGRRFNIVTDDEQCVDQ